MEHSLIFNDKNSYDHLKILVKEYPSIPFNNEQVETIEIEGRNGSLTIKKGTYKDISLEFRLVLVDMDNFWDRVDFIEEWLDDIKDNKLLYDRLDRAYVVKRIEKGNIVKDIQVQGEFTVKFICEPFKIPVYEDFEEVDEYYYYSGNIEGEPCLRVYGNGNLQLYVNGETITIKDVTNFIEIDSKFLTCKDKAGLHKENDMIGNYPLLVKGENTITHSSNVTKIEMLARTVFK